MKTPKKQPKRSGHCGDCSFYRSIINGRPYDGICTCGYGWEFKSVSRGDESQLMSAERRELERQIDRALLARQTKRMKQIEAMFKPKNRKSCKEIIDNSRRKIGPWKEVGSED